MATFIPNITDVFPKPVLAETDFNFVDKVLQRKQGLYQQGLEKVKNSFDSVLYAPLSDSANFPIRDQYITQAKESLKSLSSSDLSLPENIQAAQSIFSPFWTDEFILKDSTFTKWYQSQGQKLSSWKDSSDPKIREQYSGITSMYLNNGLDQLKNAGRNKEAYDKLQKREAVPFVNIEKYLEEMAKNDKMELVWDAQSPDGAYLISTVNGERSKQKFSNWAQGMIGNNFYEQFRVTGVVENEERIKRIKQAYPTMSDDQIRTTIANDVVDELERGYTKRKSQVDVQIAEIDAMLNNLPKTLTPDNQKYVMQLAENRTALIGKKAAIDEEYKYFNTNDKTKIRNYVITSPDIYFATLAKQRTIDGWATGKASIESKTVKQNSAWFDAQNLQMRIKEFEQKVKVDDFNAKIKILELEKDAKGKKDQTSTSTTTTSNTTTTTPGEDPVSTGRYVGFGTTNILGDKVTALDVFNKHQDELFLTAHNTVFNTDGILYFAKKGLGLSDGDVANISTALKEEIKSMYDPSAPDYTFTKEQKESSDKLTRLLKESDAVKNAGIDVKGPFSLRNALYAYSKDYLDKKFQASKDGKADPFEDKDEFTAMMNYLVGLQDLDMYNANAENKQKILEDKIFNNPEYKSLVIDRNGKKDIVNVGDIEKDLKSLSGNLEMELDVPIIPGSPLYRSYMMNAKNVTSDLLAKEFVNGNLKINAFYGKTSDRSKQIDLDAVAKVTIDYNGVTYNVPENKLADIALFANKYGKSEDFSKLNKKALEESVPDLLFYKTRTGQMGTEWSYNFNPKEENDKAFTIFNEALTSSNATIYVTDASGKSEIADAKTQAAIRQLLQDKETNAEKLIQGFRYKTQGVEGRPTIFFSIGDVSAKSEDQVGGVNLNVLNQKSFSLAISPTADSAPNLASLPSSTGMQIYQQILRGKAFSSDPILSAAGFNFTLTPNDNNNPTNVRLSLKYNLAVNEKDPSTGQLVNKINTVEDNRTLDLTGPNAKSPDEIVNYLYSLFRESMQNNRQKKLEYDAAIKANPGMMTVDRDQLFRQLFGDNFVK